MTAFRARAAFVIALFFSAFISFFAVATHAPEPISVIVAQIGDRK